MKVYSSEERSLAMSVKIAISLPEPLFERAESFSKQRGISRSQLFAQAVEEFLQRHESQARLDSLNRVYEDFVPSPSEQEARRLMKQKQRERAVREGAAEAQTAAESLIAILRT